MGPRPDVPGYADKLEGDDRDVLKLRPGITGPATLKYRLEDEQIAAFVASIRTKTIKTPEASESVSASECSNAFGTSATETSSVSNADLKDPSGDKLLRQGSGQASINLSLPEGYEKMSDQELAVWYNDNVIYPDKVRLNCYYYRHYYRGTHSTELRAGSGLRGLSSLIGLKCLLKDLEMIFATVLGRKVKFGGEEI